MFETVAEIDSIQLKDDPLTHVIHCVRQGCLIDYRGKAARMTAEKFGRLQIGIMDVTRFGRLILS